MQKFSKRQALAFGWKTMKSNFWFFIAIGLLTGLISLAPDIINFLTKGFPILFFLILSFIVNLISIILSIIVDLGWIKISLNFTDNLKSEIDDLFSQYRLFFRALFASFLFFLICLLGTILFILPGIYFAIRFYLYIYFIVDKKARIIESLKRSWEITKGQVWNLFLFNLVLFGINLLGAICLLVGLLVTLPISEVATAFVYRNLLSQSQFYVSE
jgi:hypothetical protein